MYFSTALNTIQRMASGFIGALPTLLIAFIVFIVFYFIAKRIRLIVVSTAVQRQKGKNIGLILGQLTQSAVIVAGVLVALTILFPSFQPGDLIQLLGIGSVAIGFAFRDIFQNFLAGILLLLTAHFKVGDQIVVDNFEGTVEDIQTGATLIKTYDGRHIVIPNADLFNHSVTVNTAFGRRRLEFEMLVDYREDIDHVKTLLLETINSVEGVLADPAAEALVVALTDAGINIRVYWWTRMPRQAHILHLQDKVLTLLKKNVMDAGIEFPLSSQQIFLKTPDNGSSDKQAVLLEQ